MRNTIFERWFSALLLATALIPGRAGATVVNQASANVDTSTLLAPLPTSDYWAQLMPMRPGSNEVVTVNPPLFSWFSSPGVPAYSAYDPNVYRYVFQADGNGTFTNPLVNVTTFSCCYNFLAPFSNISTVYWRVGYLSNSSNNLSLALAATWVTNCWVTNTFTIAPNATPWDRSYAASSNFMTLQHPYIIFKGTNNAAIANAMNANGTFGNFLGAASGVTNLPWFVNPAPWNTSMNNACFYSYAIAYVAAAWQLTGNPGWTNNLCASFDNLVNYYVNAGVLYEDYGNGADPTYPVFMAMCYDWLYPILTPAERANAVAAMDKRVRGDLLNGFMVTPNNTAISFFPDGNGDATGLFPGPYWVPFEMPGKMGGSHDYLNSHESDFYLALASYVDNPDCAEFLNLYLNYMIGRVTPYGYGTVNQGRSYGMEATFNYGTVDNNLIAQATFPQMGFTNNPHLKKLGDWWSRMCPPGYDQIHEQFGDVDFANDAAFWRNPNVGQEFALLTQDGNMAEQWQQFISLSGAFDGGLNPLLFLYPAIFPMPSPTINTNLGVCYPDDGWAFGSTYPPNTTQCFYQGVGFDFMARPRGSEAGHTPFSETDFEIWAYGANITDGAGGSFVGNHASFTHNTIQINGMGQVDTEAQPKTPVDAVIQAFTNAPDYVYVAADATQAYPHQPFLPDPWSGGSPAGWLMGSFGGMEANAPLTCVSKVRRELLFEHRKYFVIYDTIQTTNAPTNTFSWVYHVLTDSVANLSGGSFTYASPVWAVTGASPAGFGFSSSAVQTAVFQVVNSNSLTCTDMAGTNAYSNPITGENYYANALNDSQHGTGNALSSHSIWVANSVPTNQFHFMTVIYPVQPGTVPPVFNRLDDDTVSVTVGNQTDVISFNPNTTNIGAVTFLVNSPGIWSNAPAIPVAPPFTNTLVIPQLVNTGATPQATAVLPPTNLRVVPSPATNMGLAALSSGSFTPVTGYLAWWNPDTLSGGDTAPVANWSDLSSAGLIASQPAYYSEPVLRVGGANGHNYLSFNGASTYLSTLATGTVPQPIEFFCVVSNAVPSATAFVCGNAAGAKMGLGSAQGTYMLLAGDGMGGGTVVNGWVQLTVIINDVNSEIFVNGNLVANGVWPSVRSGGSPMAGVSIGACNAGSPTLFWNGGVGDLIIYTNILSPSQQTVVEQGLRAKYGL